MEAGRTIVVVPTYDEAENIELALRRTRSANPDVDVLVVDDSSPDGTADIARRIGEELGGVDVVTRANKDGLGGAYRHGMAIALERGYGFIGQMDADLSHDPDAFGELRAAMADDVGLVIGSRYVPGGNVPGWAKHRLLLSRWGNRYTGWMLRTSVADATSGYRLWRADVLRRAGVLDRNSRGYLFQIENAYATERIGVRIAEVPITFHDRERGQSKMSGSIIFEALWQATRWGVRDRLRREPSPGQ